ncbi:alpha/beta hydrolase [Paracoccaceae bacterium]|nr:alpha/beta hydrolase [Paracoccaceae bacterium]
MRDLVGDTPLWREMDAETVQREYSPSSAIGGDFLPFIKAYQADSEKACTACRTVKSLRYGASDTNTIDIALPESGEACPLIVYLHGGYWQLLSKRESFFGADWFVDRGVAYAAVDYTLAPDASLTEIVVECRAALVALFDQSANLNIDPARIYVAGSSAGAHLAAMCCIGVDDGYRPSGAILLSGIFELEPFVGVTDNDAVGMDIAEAYANSPLRLNIDDFPPAIISWREVETAEFKRQSRAFGAKLRSQSRAVDIFESPDRNHFDVVHDMYDPETKLGQSIQALLNYE